MADEEDVVDQAEVESQDESQEHTEETGEGSGEAAASENGESSEIVVQIGDEAEAESEEHRETPGWVKAVRKQNRELQKELRETKARLNAAAMGQPAEKPLGAKPTLQGADYDETKYEAELAAWYERKRVADERAARAKEEAEKSEQAWKQKLDGYNQAKTKLSAEDFDDAEAIVQDLFDTTQQGIIVQGSKDSALVVYALGKNPSKAKELAGIKNPIEFAFAVARLEGQLKVSSKNRPMTQPEGKVSGGGRSIGTKDATLERLRAEAEKTGDYTKVREHKSRQKARQH